jgi:hypothetical protein
MIVARTVLTADAQWRLQAGQGRAGQVDQGGNGNGNDNLEGN